MSMQQLDIPHAYETRLTKQIMDVEEKCQSQSMHYYQYENISQLPLHMLFWKSVIIYSPGTI